MFENINENKHIKNVYNNFHINELSPLEQQSELLYEDLLQISYKNNYIIDAGWYPEFNKNGKFKIYIIKNGEWNNPIKEIECNDIYSLKKYVNEFMKFIETLNDCAV